MELDCTPMHSSQVWTPTHNSFACTYFTSLIAGLGCAGLGGWLHSSIHVWWCTSSPCLVALDLYVAAAAAASCCRSYPVL
jgi:hypothetical protein